jgi:hypothetical protein
MTAISGSGSSRLISATEDADPGVDRRRAGHPYVVAMETIHLASNAQVSIKPGSLITEVAMTLAPHRRTKLGINLSCIRAGGRWPLGSSMPDCARPEPKGSNRRLVTSNFLA